MRNSQFAIEVTRKGTALSVSFADSSPMGRAKGGISLIAAVGRMMAYRPGVSGRLFAALGQNDVNVRMISQGPDEINIVFGVENKDFEKTIRILYNSFVRTDDA